MPNIRTTMDKADNASQKFFFAEVNLVLGYVVSLKRKI
jgi:hypothetical protein